MGLECYDRCTINTKRTPTHFKPRPTYTKTNTRTHAQRTNTVFEHETCSKSRLSETMHLKGNAMQRHPTY